MVAIMSIINYCWIRYLYLVHLQMIEKFPRFTNSPNFIIARGCSFVSAL